jgi:selenocysteine lyase/cysteine desulfurase
MSQDFWDQVRHETIGQDTHIRTPFGSRRLTYADYTASGRGVGFIEEYMRGLLLHYGNTHTEDDATGMLTSARLHLAETEIKRLVNAGPAYRIIETGSGATGAVHRLQQILGLYVPPATRDAVRALVAERLSPPERERLEGHLHERRPVVFVGPYEHHSNEVSWRECLAEVVEVELDGEGVLDLADLEAKLGRSEYRGRRLLGAFSAASNVSGLITPVYEVARILHRHAALAFFDYAALAPYAEIDVRRDDEAYFDGIYFSPHKFLGGPGSSGILIIHERIYRADLPPTLAGGGTVEYVSPSEQAYSADIETREKPGTPGILQCMRAALALQLKERLGIGRIAARERVLVHRAFEVLSRCPGLEIVGSRDPERRIPIVSFNIRVGSSYLHPRFTTTLLNDLFGIQSRAGCSCAGPYGHRVLGIDLAKSLRFKDRLAHGFQGVKPGWTRVSFHFLMTDEELEFILAAIGFIAEHGVRFLGHYRFEMQTGGWRHHQALTHTPRFGLSEALGWRRPPPGNREPAGVLHERYLAEARHLAAVLGASFDPGRLSTTERDLIPYLYVPVPPAPP